MSQRSLSHLSDDVTQEQNTTGIPTPILTLDPEDGTMVRLHNKVSTGDAPGLPIFAKFRDGSGNDLATDTTLILRAIRPTDDSPVAVSVAEKNIAAWNNLSTAKQRNEENIDAVKIELKGERINIRDKDILQVAIDSPDQIDWANSEFYVARQGVTEHPFEG
jgi:hypothetical protein